MTDEEIATIVDQQDLVEIAQEHMQLKRAGSGWVALCPFHSEKTPSFTIDTTGHRHMYYCFGCGAGGDALRFVQEIESWGFCQALQWLGRRVGIEVTVGRGQHDGGARRHHAALQATADTVQARYRAAYLASAADFPARQYLESRGITDEIADRWGIGFGLYLDYEEASRELQAEIGVLMPPKHVKSRFVGRITFPIRNQRGEPIGWSARAMPGTPEEKSKKYTNSPDTALYCKSEVLYGIDLAKRPILRAERVIIVEGQMDTIACHEAGLPETVAPCGTALTVEQARQLARLTHRAVLCFDPDHAGRKAARRAVPILEAVGITCDVVRLAVDPGETDPGTLVQAVRDARDYFEQAAIDARALTEPRDHMAAVRALEQDLGALQDNRYREVARKLASKTLGAELTPDSRGRKRAVKVPVEVTGSGTRERIVALLLGMTHHGALTVDPERLRSTPYYGPVRDAIARPTWYERPIESQVTAAAAHGAGVEPPQYRETADAIEAAYLEAAELAIVRAEQSENPIDAEEAAMAISLLSRME